MNEDFASRAKVLITQRRYEDAVRLCRRGLSTDAFREEGRDEGHRVLGIALLALRRLDEVRTEMTVLLQSHPTDVVARRLLGQAFMMSGDVARARDELEEARRIAPDDARITAVLARLAQATDESDPPTDVSVPPPMRPGGPPEAAMIGAIPAGAASTSTAVTPVIPAVARAAARRMAAARTGATSRPPSEPPPLPPSSARVIRSFAPQGPADRSSPPPPRPPSSRPPPPPPPSMAASTIDSLDEPLSTRDVVPTRSPAEPARQSSRPPPVKPTIGPAPPMAVPRDLLRQVPVLPAPEPPAAPARRSSVPPRGTIPPAAVIEAGPPATPAVPSPLRRLMPWAALAAVAILVLVGLLRWRAEARRAQELEAAERNEALGDDPSLRSAIREYRALADDAPTRENIARLARAHGLRALELGARDDAREGRELLELLRRSGDASEVSAPIEAAARAYLLAADGKLDEAESTLRPRRARDPHLAFLRARIALLSEAHEEALRMLRASAAAAPAWVRQSCALVEAMFARDPTDASWRQQLDVLAASHDRHFGIRLLRARLYAARPDMHAAARRELQSLAQPALWDAAGPSERAWVHLLDALLSLERPDGRDEVVRALAAAREVPAIHDVPYRLLLSRVLIELGQAAQAKSELVDLAQTAPPRARADARLLLAEAHLGLGELAEAEALLTGADDSARRHLLHGRVLMAQRKTAEALAEFRVAKTRDPSLALVVDLEGARAQLDIRETSPALQTLRALVREHPEDLSVALLLGDALLQAGDFAEAEAAYRRALRLAPDLVDARMRLATLARGRGDIAGARSMVEQISARDPGNLAAQVLAASIAGEAGDLAEAHRILSRLEGLPAAPDEAGAITILRAELSLREGTFEGVPALLERGQRAGAPEGEHQHVLGLFKLRTYRIPDALSALRRATDAASGAGVRRAELARAYQLATVPGRDAEQNAEDALRIDPDLADALAVRALVVMDSPNLGAAAPLLRQAQQSLAERPRDTNVQAYVTMARGRYDYEQGRPRDARTLLEEAIRLDGKLAEAHYFLGLAQVDLTNRAEACTELARFLELAPDVRDSADARSQRTRMGCR